MEDLIAPVLLSLVIGGVAGYFVGTLLKRAAGNLNGQRDRLYINCPGSIQFSTPYGDQFKLLLGYLFDSTTRGLCMYEYTEANIDVNRINGMIRLTYRRDLPKRSPNSLATIVQSQRYANLLGGSLNIGISEKEIRYTLELPASPQGSTLK